MKHQMIYPGESTQVNYWIRKWGISKADLNEAILETGSIGVSDIRNYLKRKKISFSLDGLIKYIRLRIK